MIVQPIPHTAKYIPAISSFSAPLFAGQYDLNQAVNTNVPVIELQQNVIYFISNISFSGIMANETYLQSISTIPQIIFKRRNDDQNVYFSPLRLVQFDSIMEAAVFMKTDKANDALIVSMSGILNQTADLIGIDPIFLTLTYNIYGIDETEYNKVFRDRIENSFSMRLNR